MLVSPLGVLAGAVFALQAGTAGWREAPALPLPSAGNAVAGIETPDGGMVLSFLGGSGSGDEAPGRAFRWNVSTDAWREAAPVPGAARSAATAVGVAGRVLLLGGRSPGRDGREAPTARVDVYDPSADRWSIGSPMPDAVEDAVAGVWRDSLVYVVGGAAADGGTLVQVYDPWSDGWSEATPSPGSPVAGHAGAVARDAIVYLGEPSPAGPGSGAPPERSGSRAWRGEIDATAPARIVWRSIPDPPGTTRHRADAVAVGTRVLFVGGGREPHAYDGSVPDGGRVGAVPGTLVYDLVTGAWSRGPGPRVIPVGSRGLARAAGWLVLAGGLDANGEPTDAVWRTPLLDALAGGP